MRFGARSGARGCAPPESKRTDVNLESEFLVSGYVPFLRINSSIFREERYFVLEIRRRRVLKPNKFQSF